jgi:uncharacterized circularly permuted ATP-grasp superfamily protein
MRFSDYDSEGFYDEWIASPGKPRPEASLLVRMLESLPAGELERRQQAAERAFLVMGITFAVYGHRDGAEKVWPFDLLPRLVIMDEWERIDRGLRQRIQALNLFLNDIYHTQRIVRDGIIPEEVIRTAKSFRPECIGLRPPAGIWAHITGTDLVRDRDGKMYVLEDNLRCPSGVSYVLENRQVMKRTFPQVFQASRVLPVDDYPSRLLDTLQFVAPMSARNPRVAVLTPGVYNSAYFEHSFLARQMGVELVEGRDLFCRDNTVYMRTTERERQVDVIYRRIDDAFLDPMQFNPNSVLGVAGVLNAARAGNVVISSAVGNGVGDDKLVYTYVPTIIEYYLGEKPLVANVDTYRCWLDDEREEVLDRVDELVVKPVEGSGGYGIVFGPEASHKELATISKKIRNDPRGWIAQPVVQLSTVPTQIDDKLAPRHVDLRPFAVNDGDDVWVLPGGLTRVALPEGSLVVNSSQGGGSKDTWVLASRASVADRELAAAEVVRKLPKATSGSKTDKNGDPSQQQQQQQSQTSSPGTSQQQQQQQAAMH